MKLTASLALLFLWVDLQVVNHKDAQTKAMGAKSVETLYRIKEKIYRLGYYEGAHPLVRDIDVCIEYDPIRARTYAFAFVAERMLALNKTKDERLSASEELETFRAWELQHEEEVEAVEAVATKDDFAEDGKPFDHFDVADIVSWTIELVTGEEMSDCFVVFWSEDDIPSAVDRQLKEAMFLSEYTSAQVAPIV